ncbi:MAG: transposase [Dehalococcoidia bacterium]
MTPTAAQPSAGFQPARNSTPAPRPQRTTPPLRTHATPPATTTSSQPSAGFQPARNSTPASRFTTRRPWHEDAAGAPYFVSTRTHKSTPIFRDETLARIAIRTLTAAGQTYNFALLAYCFMPDHAHVVIVPSSEHNISAVMRIAKGAIARQVNSTTGRSGAGWQTGFFDKVPKDLDELNTYIRYVGNNPVAARFVQRASDFEFSSAHGECLDAYHAFIEGDAPADNRRPVDNHQAKAARAESPRSNQAQDTRGRAARLEGGAAEPPHHTPGGAP